MNKIKIIVIGPLESGKTVLSNIIADATDSSNREYSPTRGVRILEFESDENNVRGRKIKLDVELWDCSGDNKYEECWSAIAKDQQGVVFVYNPERSDQSDDLERLYQYFVQQYGLKSAQCAIIANNKSGGFEKSHTRPPAVMAGLSMMMISNLDEDGEVVRNGFRSYLKQLLEIVSEKQRQEEDNLVIA